MYKYEVWMQHKWGMHLATPEITCASLDEAMFQAKKRSKNKESGFGTEFMPTLFVLDYADLNRRVRGFGINGKWLDAIENCKSCNNNYFDCDDCIGCRGASWKP